MHPAVGLPGPLPVAQMSKLPGMLHRVPEVEDFTTVYKLGGSIPDPLGSIAHDDYHGVGAKPAQFPQLGIQAREDRIGVAQTGHQKPAHHRVASRRDLDALLGQQQDSGLDLLEVALLHGRQRRQLFGAHPAAAFLRTCIPNMQPSTLKTTDAGAWSVAAPTLRLSP